MEVDEEDIELEEATIPQHEETKDTDELAEFRAKWMAELDGGNDQTLQGLSRAEELYWMGVTAEELGDMTSAVYHYKQAVQLEPDIEQKISTTQTTSIEQALDISKHSHNQDNDEYDTDSITHDMLNLRIDPKQPLCLPLYKTKASHISLLPLEILQNILCMAILQDLDMRTLEQFGMVCKGFYILARENFIWKKACYRLWGNECTIPSDYQNNWRLLYITLPHVHFNGVYISRSSYVRIGEKSLDKLYRPFHTVIYYRYLRFHSDGTVVYITSPEEPSNMIGHLRYKINKEGMMHGHYTHTHNIVCVSVSTASEVSLTKQYGAGRNRRHRPMVVNERCDKFEMEFQINNNRKRLSSQLCWKKFSSESIHIPSGHVQTSDFSIDNTYTPFLFSRVKSYSIIDQQNN